MQVSITNLVALTGIHRNRLARLLQDLPCTAGAKGAKVYESVDALRVVYQANAPDRLDPQQERAKLDQARRLEIERKAEVESGLLLRAEEVTAVWVEVARNSKAVLLAIPSRAAPDLLRCTGLKEVEDKLRAAIHDALDLLSSPPPVKPIGDSPQTA